MGLNNPAWWMRHRYQAVDMEKNALRAATANRQPQNIWVPAAKMEEFGLDMNDTHMFTPEGPDGGTWVRWKLVQPDPNGTAAGLPNRRFPWEE